MEISKTTQRAQGEEIKRIPIARCPVDGCERTLLYSTDPKEKSTVTVCVAKPDYQGKTMLCPRCKTMLAVIEKPKVARGYVAIPVTSATFKLKVSHPPVGENGS